MSEKRIADEIGACIRAMPRILEKIEASGFPSPASDEVRSISGFDNSPLAAKGFLESFLNERMSKDDHVNFGFLASSGEILHRYKISMLRSGVNLAKQIDDLRRFEKSIFPIDTDGSLVIGGSSGEWIGYFEAGTDIFIILSATKDDEYLKSDWFFQNALQTALEKHARNAGLIS